MSLEKPDNIGERYLVGNSTMSHRELDKMIGAISGASPPKMSLPGSVVKVNAIFTTWLSDALKEPPIPGMCKDSIGEISHDTCFDGGKTERELGITYTPICVAVE